MFSVKSNPLDSLFIPLLYFLSNFFEGLIKNYHYGEKIFSTKRKFNLDEPKLQYLRVSTAILVCKYWTLAKLNISIVS